MRRPRKRLRGELPPRPPCTIDYSVPPDPNSVEIMREIDRMPRRCRALVHEYGLVIVSNLLAEAVGHVNPDDLAWELETWRERRQEQWLATDFITPRTRRSFGLNSGGPR